MQPMKEAAREAVARLAKEAGMNITYREVTLLADEALAAIKKVAKENALEGTSARSGEV